jgi:CRP/FNR family transcriptional regulator, cyclic AMP receptor protein
MSADATLLAGVPFFQLLDESERELLASHLEHVRLPVGHIVCEYGDPGDSLFVIRSGAVEVFFKNDTGERVTLERAVAGDFFGELSLLDGGARSASVQVVENLEALVLDRESLENFLKRHPAAALDLLAATGRRLRQTAERLRHTATRNVNEEVEDRRTIVQKAADWIAEFSGSIPFLGIHVIWFTFWILANVGMLPGIPDFDPFPFGLLTMIVSLEAIVLSVFVLLSQNRQAEKERVRSDIEYDVNLKAELEVAQLHEKVDRLHVEVTRRLEQLTRKITVPHS